MMNLSSIRRKCVGHDVWLDRVERRAFDGSWAGDNVHLWRVDAVRRRKVVLSNLSTQHVVELDARNLKQFDERSADIPYGAIGAFVLRSAVVLSGCNAFKSVEDYLIARRTRPQIFLPVTIYSSHQMFVAVALSRFAAVAQLR